MVLRFSVSHDNHYATNLSTKQITTVQINCNWTCSYATSSWFRATQTTRRCGYLFTPHPGNSHQRRQVARPRYSKLQHGSGLPTPQKECGNCDVDGGKHTEMYLLFRMKVFTKFASALFDITKRKNNSLTADSIRVIQHRLGFPPRRRLV
jgi:hypothetical protein